MGRVEETTARQVPVTSTLIRHLPAAARPRERLQQEGAKALSEAELVAILLRTGTRGRSAIAVAQELLRRVPLSDLVSVPLEELAKTKGIGPAKAVQLKAAFELAKRLSRPRERLVIADPSVAAGAVRDEMRDLDREEFRVLLLTTKTTLIRIADVSRGTLNASLVEPREVFKDAIAASAAGLILVHNHPSGDPTPSSEDIAITRRLVKAGELLGITVHDHVILGRPTAGRDQDFVSLKQLGLL
jgi:DNA repair protein RadC